MRFCRRAVGPWALGLVLLTATGAPADRVVSQKVPSMRCPGVRGDSTVPYTTNGFSTLGVYQRVSPYIYSAPEVFESYSYYVQPDNGRSDLRPGFSPYRYGIPPGIQNRWTGEFYTVDTRGFRSLTYYVGARPVFNLPFYGATLGFSSRSTGAVYQPWPLPIPR
jgi:hypothetical protein